MLANCFQDLRYGARTLNRSKGFAAVAVVSLALGIGANSAVLSVLDSVSWRRLPVSHPDQLVLVRRSTGTPRLSTLSYPLFSEVAERKDVFKEICASGELFVNQVRLAGGEPISRPTARLVTTNYFTSLGVRASAGRLFRPGDSDAVSVISQDFWQRQWGRVPAAIGATLIVNKVTTTIVGVTPPGFFGDTVGLAPDIFLPMELQPRLMPGLNWLTNGRSYWMVALGRLQPGVSRLSATVALQATFQQFLLKQGRKDSGRERMAVVDGSRGVSNLEEQFAQPLHILMGIAGLLLLVGCGNLANLLLARASAREKEISIRVALGAGRGRVAQQVLTECLLLSFVGALFALAVAVYGRQALVVMASDPANPIRGFDQGMDWRILSITVGFALLTTVLFGLVPAIRSSQVRVADALKMATSGTGIGRERRRLGKLLIASQVSLSVIMLAGTALMLRTVGNLRAVDTGFRPDNVLLVRFAFEPSMDGLNRLARIAAPLGERLRSLPEIVATGFSTYGGLSNSYQTTSVALPSGPPEAFQDIRMNLVSAGYFEAYGIELLQGRSFRESDTSDSPKVVIVNLTAARRFFPGEDPLGKRFSLDARFKASDSFEVVGVSRDAKWRNLREDVWPTIFVSLGQVKNPALFVTIRTQRKPAALAGTLRSVVRETDPQLGIDLITTLEDEVKSSMRTELMLTKLTGVFGMLALLLVSTGIYGIISYSVSRRTREFGIRLALGADTWRIRSIVLREVAITTCAGIVAGLPVAMLAGSLVEKVLFGVKAHDAVALGAAVLLIVIAALSAAWIPARRASSVEPITALRWE